MFWIIPAGIRVLRPLRFVNMRATNDSISRPISAGSVSRNVGRPCFSSKTCRGLDHFPARPKRAATSEPPMPSRRAASHLLRDARRPRSSVACGASWMGAGLAARVVLRRVRVADPGLAAGVVLRRVRGAGVASRTSSAGISRESTARASDSSRRAVGAPYARSDAVTAAGVRGWVACWDNVPSLFVDRSGSSRPPSCAELGGLVAS